MRYFYDTEFIEDGKTIELISIGFVCEDGRELYLQNADCRFYRTNQWVKENVLAHLIRFSPDREPVALREQGGPWKYHGEIGDILKMYVGDDKAEFWGYYSAYDHVVLCQLFGTMMDLPKGFPMYTRDIKQLCDELGNPRLPEQGKGEHHALADARWNQQAYHFLKSYNPR